MIIYTDGSARPTNPGPGGFSLIVLDDDENIITAYTKHYDIPVTNNQMEMYAILYALIKFGDQNPVVYSDSSYAINTFDSWRFAWEQNGWLKKDGKIPENLNVIQTYKHFWDDGNRIQLRKIKGHTGNRWNELADKLANQSISLSDLQMTFNIELI